MISALRTINYRCQGASRNGVVLRVPLARGAMKSDSNNAPTVNLAGIQRAKWTEKSLFGGLRGYAAGAFFLVAALALSCLSTPSIGSSEQA
jgi:hypothetical protein